MKLPPSARNDRLRLRLTTRYIGILIIAVLVVATTYVGHSNALTAPALVDYQESNYQDTSATETTTAAATWQAGDLIIVLGGNENGAASMTTPTATGLTFSLVLSTGVGDSHKAPVYLWSATAGSNGSSTVSSTGASSNMCGLSVFVYRGSGGIGNSATITASTAKTISLTRSTDNSAVATFLNDWNAVNDTTVTPSPSSGGTQRVAAIVNSRATMFADEWTDQGTAGTTSYGITNHTGTVSMDGIAVEIKGGAPTNTTPTAPTLSSPAAGTIGASTTPQFQLRSTDADGDYLRYKIEVCNVSDCSAVLSTIDQASSQSGWASQDVQSATAYTGSDTIANSTMASYFYPAPPLAPNTQYWWRAYAIDPGGSNTLSSASSINTFTTAPTEVKITGGTTILGGTKIAN